MTVTVMFRFQTTLCILMSLCWKAVPMLLGQERQNVFGMIPVLYTRHGCHEREYDMYNGRTKGIHGMNGCGCDC
jgi:hypothetical protein